MTQDQKKEITKISKQFSSGFKEMIPSINGSGWMIVDPLSGYLNAIGYENTVGQLPGTDQHPLVLVIKFKDGSLFIPAGADLKPITEKAKNWMWI